MEDPTDDFTYYGTNDSDDVMVRELPNLERAVADSRRALEDAERRLLPDNPHRQQCQRENDEAVRRLEEQRELIRDFRRRYPRSADG